MAFMARPKFAPKSSPYRGPIPKPHYYLLHRCSRPTYDAKQYTYFDSSMHVSVYSECIYVFLSFYQKSCPRRWMPY